VRLGSIKLLVKGNPPALQTPDNSGALPLHVACQLHDSVNVVQYLVGLDATTLDAVDRDGNTALHLACHCARHEIIAMLLEKYGAVSVSKRNTLKKLPIDLLWERSEVLDRESIEYTESVFRLLTAHPETLMNVNMKQPADASN
jgi:ankyrin repeat protein